MIQFIPRAKKNIKSQKTMFYAQIAPTLPMTIKDVIAQIERQCTVTAPDVLAVLNALQHVIIQALHNGHSVRLGDLGSFRPTLVSYGVNTALEVTAKNIRRVRCRFTPSASITNELAMSNVELQMFKMPAGQGSSPEII